MPGYWAIGRGAYAAISALAARRHTLTYALAPTIYHVCEAKFSAESVPEVGEQTFVQVHDQRRRTLYVDNEMLSQLRRDWALVGKPRPANEAYGRVHGWMKTKDDAWQDPGASPSTAQTAMTTQLPAATRSAENDQTTSVDQTEPSSRPSTPADASS
jgi:hypothetical protein